MSKLDVSFNSPQCGFMSIGFSDPNGEFHTTAASFPHAGALADLLKILSGFLAENGDGERTLCWNRDPEEYDFRFSKSGDELTLEIIEFATGDRTADTPERMFFHRGSVRDVCAAFFDTFSQLFEDRDTDEFEFNWRQPFPRAEFEELGRRLGL